MKAYNTLGAVLVACCWLAQARVVHLDVTNHGVSIDIESNSRGKQGKSHGIAGKGNAKHSAGAKSTESNPYDVDLSSYQHRGFLSVRSLHQNMATLAKRCTG